MRELSASESARLLQEQADETVLLDVREHPELALASVSGATHIPMGEIPARLHELDQDKLIICMCHLGGRSAQVGTFLETQGFNNIANLSGGIMAWSTDVDSSVPAY